MSELKGAIRETQAPTPFKYQYINKVHPSFLMPSHYHQDFEMIKVLQGKLNISLNERLYLLNKDDVLFIAEGIAHSIKPCEVNACYESISFNLNQLFDFKKAEYADLKKIVSGEIVITEYFSPKLYPNLQAFIQNLFTVFNPKSNSSILSILGSLISFFGFIIDYGLYQQQSLNLAPKFVRHLCKNSMLFRYIFINYNHNIKLEELAKLMDMSPKYFCRYFLSLTGNRPLEYVNRYRIELAAERLGTKGESINEIAFDCGFKNPGYFARLFKRYKGLSPSAYRIRFYTN